MQPDVHSKIFLAIRMLPIIVGKSHTRGALSPLHFRPERTASNAQRS